MTMIGYARASTEDQSVEIQVEALRAAGCTTIRTEKRSGTSREGRTELATVMDFLRSGDVLCVTRVDRLARSLSDLAAIVDDLQKRGVALKATEQPIDTSTPAGMAFLQMLGVFAQFETAIRKERQMEGIAKAKAAGVYKGGKTRIDLDEVRRLKAEGLGPTAIGAKLGVSREHVSRLLKAG